MQQYLHCLVLEILGRVSFTPLSEILNSCYAVLKQNFYEAAGTYFKQTFFKLKSVSQNFSQTVS